MLINTGHYQPFKHPHVRRSPPIGVEKLFGVFMNNKPYNNEGLVVFRAQNAHCTAGPSQEVYAER